MWAVNNEQDITERVTEVLWYSQSRIPFQPAIFSAIDTGTSPAISISKSTNAISMLHDFFEHQKRLQAHDHESDQKSNLSCTPWSYPSLWALSNQWNSNPNLNSSETNASSTLTFKRKRAVSIQELCAQASQGYSVSLTLGISSLSHGKISYLVAEALIKELEKWGLNPAQDLLSATTAFFF